jgi:hypothetical protein
MEYADLFKHVDPLSKGIDIHRVVECDETSAKSPEENLALEVGGIIDQIASQSRKPLEENPTRSSMR